MKRESGVKREKNTAEAQRAQRGKPEGRGKVALVHLAPEGRHVYSQAARLLAIKAPEGRHVDNV